MVMGLMFFVLGLASLGDSWRLGIDKEELGQLVTRGICALSRNPIYLFFDLYFLGTFLVNGALIFLVFALLVIANLHYQIVQEEPFLARVHEATHTRYCATVDRQLSWRPKVSNPRKRRKGGVYRQRPSEPDGQRTIEGP